MNQIWEEIRRILSKSLTSTAMETWFSGCKILEINDTEAVFVAADEFRKSVIEKRFTSSLKDALKELPGQPVPWRSMFRRELPALS